MLDRKKVQFNIKLLSGNNVVLLEAKGYESEIFMPEIISGRLTFQNVIPNRRCPSMLSGGGDSLICRNNNRTVEATQLVHTQRKPLMTLSSKQFRVSGGQEDSCSTSIPRNPIANSTPLRRVKPNVSKENSPLERRSATDRLSHSSQCIRTPEVARAVPVHRDTLVQIPPGIKVLRLYRNSTPSIIKKTTHDVGTYSNEESDPIAITTPSSKESTKEVSTSFRLPLTPNFNSNNCSRNSLVRKPTTLLTRRTIVTPATAIQWRRCITPTRTYARRAISNLRRRSSLTFGVLLKSPKHRRVLPTYLTNQTQGHKATKRVQILRKRKLIIDPKATMSPSTFKKQHSRIDDLASIGGNHKTRLPATHKEYERSKRSAFDLLTNSNRVQCMSDVLTKQFRQGCINKASSTHAKYKVLSTVPPLRRDHETREINRLQAEQTSQYKTRSQAIDNATAVAMAEKACIQAAQKYVNAKQGLQIS